ncbi:Manganese transporter [Podosphaera aphanis]|nr:Manganese transporter [Podosphaera aphanis]
MINTVTSEEVKDKCFHQSQFLPNYEINKEKKCCDQVIEVNEDSSSEDDDLPERTINKRRKFWREALTAVRDYLRFIGPGFMISVAYIDPGNYSVDVAAGAGYRFQLLFVGLIANFFAIFLQALCVKLGSVTGLNLAEACRAFLPKWLNFSLYAIAELSIITTDVAEVAGTAIAINILIPKIPLVAACAMSIFDVLIIRALSSPDGSLKGLRFFEFFVMALVIGVAICFCVQLCLIRHPTIGEVLAGYLPSKRVFRSQGIYQSCGILGATIMPHSLFLGSGIVQTRLKEYDIKNGLLQPPVRPKSGVPSGLPDRYQPSLQAIRSCLKLFYIELIICLFVFALFINSSILITTGATLYTIPLNDANLYGIHDHLAYSLGPVAASIFALALLLSGISAGIVCTITGQMVSMGALNWRVAPWVRRLITRSISIMPVIIIAAGPGKQGLDQLMLAAQAVLSMMLPLIIAPLIYFTSRDRYMTVQSPPCGEGIPSKSGSISWSTDEPMLETKMTNKWHTTAFALFIWLTITSLNVGDLIGKIISSLELLHG